VPEQETGFGRFRVTLRERQRISRELVGTGQMIVVQVHSHPEGAFHSWIDDQEAIPRRVGAYSLVIPDFGSRPHLLEEAALFQLQESGSWNETSIELLTISALARPEDSQPAATTTLQRRTLRWLIGTLKSFGRSRT
jgi:hypothetical protein